jgi:hypothetical protein
MRRAVTEALHVAAHRIAFGRRLADMPLMRRQLCKLILPAEQARVMAFQAAEALRRSDAGDADAYALVRILTPLLKFRACRDARKVTGDAMEVRGGCGYIEEWPEPRLVRDAHLGSIWEGTSNIVALDVLRAARREGSLAVLERRLDALRAELGESQVPGLESASGPVFDLVQTAMAEGGDRLARQAASALYHLTTATALAWEGARLNLDHRVSLARLVLRHRLSPRDPLAPDIADGDLDSIVNAALRGIEAAAAGA